MLTEIRLDDIPESASFSREATPDGEFAEETVDSFIDSGMMIAEVNGGWPGGNPTTAKETSRCANLLRNKIEKKKITNISVLQRGNRIFLQKLIVRRINN